MLYCIIYLTSSSWLSTCWPWTGPHQSLLILVSQEVWLSFMSSVTAMGCQSQKLKVVVLRFNPCQYGYIHLSMSMHNVQLAIKPKEGLLLHCKVPFLNIHCCIILKVLTFSFTSHCQKDSSFDCDPWHLKMRPTFYDPLSIHMAWLSYQSSL